MFNCVHKFAKPNTVTALKRVKPQCPTIFLAKKRATRKWLFKVMLNYLIMQMIQGVQQGSQ
jgi:hypothetical protein